MSNDILKNQYLTVANVGRYLNISQSKAYELATARISRSAVSAAAFGSPGRHSFPGSNSIPASPTVSSPEVHAMARKRSHGEGSVWKLKNGMWRGQLMDGYTDGGKKNIISFSGETAAKSWKNSGTIRIKRMPTSV